MPRNRPARPADAPGGFTLLEVILALAILAGALAVLGDVSYLSHRNARNAALESEAAIIAESILSELDAGTAQLINFGSDWSDDEQQDPVWKYEVTIEQTSMTEMLQARIHVEEIDPGDEKPVIVELVRWYQDPDYIAQVEAAIEAAATE